MQAKYKIIGVIVGLVIVAGLFFPIGNSPVVRLGALPVYQIFQLTSPAGYGIVMSNGIATSTLAGSSTPTIASLTATSSLRVTNQINGCAQFDSTGVLSSVGSNCASSAAGKEINYYAATSSSPSNVVYTLATTTSQIANNSFMVWTVCASNSATSRYLVAVTNQGTTTLARTSTSAMSGLYTATTTGLVTFKWVNSDLSTETSSTACGSSDIYSFNLMYQRFTN